MICLFISSLLLFSNAFGAVHLPPEIQKCSKSDPKFNSCMAKSMTDALEVFKEGSKELGLPALNPLQIERLEIAGVPGKSVNLNQVYENVKMHGLIDSKVVDFSLTDDGKTCLWELVVKTPMSRMEADYSLKGQVMVFPINGHGKCNVTLYNVVNRHRAVCEEYKKKGNTYGRLKDYTMNMTVDNCVFDFENMFPGNEQISKEIGKAINENSLSIFQEVKQGFEEVLSRLHENGANSVYARIPLNELYLP